ncbi:hypothetical protein PsYK624_024160 [Phanerochaete sordida]|uniref:Zn(2)-C6 fungal-type domain-containing protein n=1 Tax=Phanerochaete sordida TaxID=48140 RepID=A0A9P3L8Q0_9APHY|nr:hypothetical protein PsYK624_024160 [Phanerochaete sordida]
MDGTPAASYDLDDGASMYQNDTASTGLNGDAPGSHTPNGQSSGSAASKASNSTHIRSRITVVCAECKRLKLKCDRRTPCSSCVKRDTMARCVYSQAAAEKIDVQSLHNRLLAVEGQVATLTANQASTNPSIPPFRSTYPLSSSQTGLTASPSGTTPGSSRPTTSALGGQSNDRYLLISGQSGSSLVVNLEDTAGVWLSELEAQLGIDDASKAPSTSPYSVALPAVTSSGTARVKLEPTPVVLSPSTLSTSTTPASSAPSPAAASVSSPATSIQGSGLKNVNVYVPPIPYSTFQPEPSASYAHQRDLPQVTPALLHLLPPSPIVRTRYLKGLSDAMMVHPCFNFRHFEQRIDAMMAWGDAHDPSKQKSDLARELFNSGAPKQRPTLAMTSPKPTLSFFAAASAAFALGAVMARDPGDPTADADAMQRNSPATLFALSKQSLTLFEETATYDVDSIIAMLLHALYLLHDGSLRIEHTVFPLVGKLINIARLMGLHVDPDEFPGSYSLFEAETRRRIWWDIVYYDMVVSDFMGHPSLLTETAFSTKIPRDVEESLFGPSSTTIPAPPEDRQYSSIQYFILRCKLAQLCKNVRRQITRDVMPEDSPEASIDHAAMLEKEVMGYLQELPPTYRLDMELDCSQPLEGDSVLIAQRAALVVIANRVIIKLYLPFMKDTGENSPGKVSHQAVLGTISAAHSIIYALRVLYTVWRATRPGIFEYYDYTRSLFDAAVICAHAVIQQPASILACEGMKGIAHALEIMREMHAVRRTVAPDTPSEAVKIVEMMMEKAERARAAGTALAGTKRKRAEEDWHAMSSLSAGFQLPFVGPSVTSVKVGQGRPPLAMSKVAATGPKVTVAPEPKGKGKDRAREKRDDVVASTSASARDFEAESSNRERELEREREAQDLAQSERARHPLVGVRCRAGTGQPPPTRQRTSSTTSMSPPTPGPGISQATHMPPTASSSAAQTPIEGASFSYPPPQPQESHPPPMHAMQHDFQMDFSSQASSPHAYAHSPQIATHAYDSRKSPYAAATPGAPAQEYYMPYPTPQPQAYEPVEHAQGMAQPLAPYGVNPGLPQIGSVPSTPRGDAGRFALPPEKPPPPYDHRLPKPLDYPQHAGPSGHHNGHNVGGHVNGHGSGHGGHSVNGHNVSGHMQMTATSLTQPYVQGWQPADMSRPDGNGIWDYKFYTPGAQ